VSLVIGICRREGTNVHTVDPETKAEFEEMQKKSPIAGAATNPAQSIQNFDMASWLAGKSEQSASSSRGHSPAPQGKKQRN
jgi:ER membrane protein complex subunit 7